MTTMTRFRLEKVTLAVIWKNYWKKAKGKKDLLG